MNPFLYVYSVRMITFNVFLGYYIPNALRKMTMLLYCLTSLKYVTVFGLVAPVQR